jgi:hypothetical protein
MQCGFGFEKCRRRARKLMTFSTSRCNRRDTAFEAASSLCNRGDQASPGDNTCWNLIVPASLTVTIRGTSMPSSQLKRAERAIQSIRDQAELPPETADALQELVDVVRYIDGRLSALESKGKSHPTESMALPNRK